GGNHDHVGGWGSLVWLAILVGGFYMVAGLVLMRQMALERVLDYALSRITLDPTGSKERLKFRMLVIGGALVFGAGLSVSTLSRYAAYLFSLAVLWQGGYLLWAARY